MNALLHPIILSKMTHSYLFDINRAWKYTKEDLTKYQSKKLRQIVRYAYTVPLYHEKYKKAKVHPDDIKNIKDIEKLPYVSKKDFRGKENKYLLPVNAKINNFSMSSTSGSTGQPVTFFNNQISLFNAFIGFIRILRAHDLSWRKHRIAVLADLSPDSIENAFFTRGGMDDFKSVFSFKNIKIFDISQKPEVLIEKINAFTPEFLGGYPQIIRILSTLKRNGKANDLEPRIIITTGATLDDYTRQYIAKSFNSKVIDMYGATEISPIAFQCKNNNYHINSDFVYIEYIDPKEKEEKYADGGNVVITRLYGSGTPLIRYTGLSDFITQSKRICNCGLNIPIFDHIGGRKVDSIVLPNGEIIPPFTITGIPSKVMLKLKTDKITQFQIIQRSLEEIDILILIDDRLRNVGPSVKKISEEMKKQFKKRINSNVKINVREVSKVESLRSGTAAECPIVISKIT
ncbi:MAG: phenylacetate--CoA ligase family protein [Promethearchaeota archaeon]|jgi:phenylacetate-CoA ligase